ncbi:hypothetical protein ACO1O0_001632 [Amphichorda felina]
MSSATISDTPTLPAQEEVKGEVKEEAKGDAVETPNAQPSRHLEGVPLVLVCIGLALGVFCLGLDRSILATAIPKITSQFNSLDDVAWYGSSYLLTTCCFQLMFGKLYADFKVKWVFTAALALFEIGSLVAGCAPNSVALIIGRAIQGVGCAGVLTGAFTIIALVLPLHKRPVYTGLIGSVSGISQIIAPTLGGVFTDRATWRWCFWINLPLGAVTVVVVIFFVKLPPKPKSDTPRSYAQLLRKLDLPGTLTLMPSIVCLLLALQWGGLKYPWGNWRVILCLVIFAVLIVVWFYIQYRRGDEATLPLRILKQRSVASGVAFALCSSGTLFVIVYYVPIWFQSVQSASAEKSGINFLASTAAMSVTAVLSGVLTSKSGYYVPQMYASVVLMSVSAGLVHRYQLDTTTVYWAATLVLFGLGAGIGMQMPITAAQTVLRGNDIPLGTSLLILIQTLAGTIFLAVGQNLFQTELIRALGVYVPGVDPRVVIHTGVSNLDSVIKKAYGAEAFRGVLDAYNTALKKCFLVCLILACLSIVGPIFMEWKNVKVESAKEAQEHNLE